MEMIRFWVLYSQTHFGLNAKVRYAVQRNVFRQLLAADIEITRPPGLAVHGKFYGVQHATPR